MILMMAKIAPGFLCTSTAIFHVPSSFQRFKSCLFTVYIISAFRFDGKPNFFTRLSVVILLFYLFSPKKDKAIAPGPA